MFGVLVSEFVVDVVIVWNIFEVEFILKVCDVFVLLVVEVDKLWCEFGFVKFWFEELGELVD